MKKTTISTIHLLLLGALAFAQKPSHPKASSATNTLFKNLYHLQGKHIMFGHQDDLAYGVGWKYVKGRSDIKSVVNDYPAVYGWDIGKIEYNSPTNLDGVPFDKMRQYIQQAYQKGAVITISWHLGNPLTGGSSWDTAKNTVKSILPQGAKHQEYVLWLDRAAQFLASLKDQEQNLIPILFRPFHEEKGNWFWWGKPHRSKQDYIALWRFTIDYLRETKQLNNLIVAFNSNDFNTEKQFLESYPGDQWVDLLSMDKYQYQLADQSNFIATVRKQLGIISNLAMAKKKLSAFAETGFEAIPDPNWWTQTLWPAIKDIPISYVLVWRNAGYSAQQQKMHYYAPYKGQISEKDFKSFYKQKQMMFEKQLQSKKIYRNQ